MTTKKTYSVQTQKENGLWTAKIFKEVNGNPMLIHSCSIVIASKKRAIALADKKISDYVMGAKEDNPKENVRMGLSLLEQKGYFPIEDISILDDALYIIVENGGYFFKGDVRKVLKTCEKVEDFLMFCETI